MIEFYDLKPLDSSPDEWYDIERMYCFDWDKFDKGLFDQLNKIFVLLPHSIKHDSHDCSWWYSDRENIETGYLTASMEPPGLQVFGTLKSKDWQEWEQAFHGHIAGLPFRKVE